MRISWTQHAKERYNERIIIHGISQVEIEQIVKKQEVRILECFDEKYKKEKFKTIGKIAQRLFTIEKAEDSRNIYIITLWESSQKEEEEWNSRKQQNAQSAAQQQSSERKQ